MMMREWLVGVTVLYCLDVIAVQADDWPQFRGPDRDAVWHEDGIPETFAPEGLPVRWRVPVGPGYASPVVWQQRV
jgi:hypothetical protein